MSRDPIDPAASSRSPAPEGKEGEENKEPVTFSRALYDWLEALIGAVVLVILLFLFVGRFIYVDGHSMLPTLQDRDMMLVTELGYSPKQGDVVVLTKSAFLDQPIVKRVIAVGGQQVDIDYEAGTVSVDGVALQEPYILEAMERPTNPYMGNEHVLVPEGSIYVMGDNRNHSSDSRYATLGTVDVRHVIGRAYCVVFPFQDFGLIR